MRRPAAGPERSAEARQFLIWVTPHGFIKAAMADPNATVTDREFVGAGRTLRVVGFTTMGKYRATGEFNAQNMLERVVTWIPSPVMGDMQVEIRYTIGATSAMASRRRSISTCTRAIIPSCAA